jgi:Holliday junction resolvasome RuvABC endonuclease subunit
MKKTTYPDLILALTLSTRGFAYVFFETPQTPYDWAVVETKGSGKDTQIMMRVEKLIQTYYPQTLVLEDVSAKSGQRPPHLKKLSLKLTHVAECEGVEVCRYDRKAIRAAFASVGAKTKAEIAHAIASAIPAFAHRLPPIRKLWMSEDPRQMLFDAAALAVTHFADLETRMHPIENFPHSDA